MGDLPTRRTAVVVRRRAAPVQPEDPAREPAPQRGRRIGFEGGHRGPRQVGSQRRPDGRDRLHARARGHAGLHRRPRRRRPRRDARRDGGPWRRRVQDQPAGPRRAGHRPLRAGRLLRHARGVRAERREGVRAQQGALRVPALGPGRLRGLPGRPAGHRHRPPGQPRVPGARRFPERNRIPATPGLPRHARRDRLPHDDDQRPRRAGLGRRRHRGRGGDARPADVDADPAASSASSSRASCPRARPRPTSSSPSPSCCASTASSASSSSSTARALANLPLADRATIGNMSPEFGSTCAIFPIDAETLRYLEFSGRPKELIELVEAYAKEQGLWHDENSEDADLLGVARARPRRRRAVAGRAQAPAGPRPADRRQGDVPRGADQLRRGRRRQRGPRDARTTRRSPSASRRRTRRPTARRANETPTTTRKPRRGVAGGGSVRRESTSRATGGHGDAGRRGVRARPRPRRDRGDHLVHEHLEPVGDGRRRAPRPQRGREGARPASRGSRRRWRRARRS